MIATEETVRFVMPPTRIGQTVLFFRFGSRDGKLPFVGYIIERKASTVKIKTVDGEIWGAVRHIDDPRLKESEEQRRDLGAWDYTDEEKNEALFKQEVRDRLAALERQVSGLVSHSVKKGNG